MKLPRTFALNSLWPLASLMSLSLCAAESPPAVAGFRGDGSGKAQNATPPIEWSETKNVKWRTEVGAAYSSPIAIGGKVFVTSEPDLLICLNADDGKILWQAAHGEKDLPGDVYDDVKEFVKGKTMCGYAAPTPACDGQNVIAHFGTGLTACYGMDGKRKWLRHIKPEPSEFGHSTSPVIAGGKVLVNVGSLTALDLNTGNILWTQADAPMTFGTPIVTTLDGTLVVITPLAQAVRLSDGKLLAKELVKNLGDEEYSCSPIVQDGVAYFLYDTTTAVKLTLQGDAIRGETLWRQHLGGEYFAAPLCQDGLLFAIDKAARYYVLDAKTGAKLLSKTLELAPAGGASATHSDAHVYPSIALAGGALFLSNDAGETFVLAPQKEYKEMARNSLPEGSGATPAFAGSAMFVRSGKFIYCFGR